MQSLWTVAVAVAVTQLPCRTCNAQGAFSGPPVSPYGTVQPYSGSAPYSGAPAPVSPYGAVQPYGGPPPYSRGGVPPEGGTGPVSYSGSHSAVGGPVSPGGGGYDILYQYDATEPWVRGYWQDIPSYGGHVHFRPYNYKHALSQSQVAAGWGMSPTMPYSQELFRRYPPPSNTQQAQADRPGRSEVPFDERVYRAEMARLRAQRDFDHRRPAAVETLPDSGANLPATLNAPAGTPAKSPGVTPTAHSQARNPRLDELQEKILKQQRDLQELQEALRRESGK